MIDFLDEQEGAGYEDPMTAEAREAEDAYWEQRFRAMQEAGL